MLLSLKFNANEGSALLFRLDDANGLPVSEKKVVSLAKAATQSEFANGNPAAGVDSRVGPVLDEPSGSQEHTVYGLAGCPNVVLREKR